MSTPLLLTRREFGMGLMGLTQIGRKDLFDVVVIGAGVFGVWIAYECQLRGWSVLLLDSRGPANSMASSGGESRILRVGYGPQMIYSRWALRSLALWHEFLEGAHAQQLFLPTGVLWLGPREESYLASTIKSLRELDVRFEVLDYANLRDRYPQINVDTGYLGILEADGGTILARRVVNVLIELTVSRGTIYRTSVVLPPHVNGRLHAIQTGDGETIRADRFVFACGPWLPKLFPDVIGSNIQPTRQEVFFIAAPPGDTSYQPDSMPSWVDFTSSGIFYGCPNIEGRGVKVAADKHGLVIDPDEENRIPTARGLAVIRSFLHLRFPRISVEPCIETRVCQYENTRSGDFLIDRHPKSSNVWIVGGGSGHGFKHGPAVGEYVVSLLADGHYDARFSLEAASKHETRTVH
jgi:sarcosine oxidase